MPDESLPQDYILTVYGILAGTTFAALFFILQVKDTLRFPDLTIGSIAFASALFVLLLLSRLNISQGRIAKDSSFSKTTSKFGILGFFLLIWNLILLLIQISLWVGIVVLVLTLICGLILNLKALKSKPKW